MYYIFSILLALSTFNSSHDVPLAIFDCTIHKDHVSLLLHIDALDIQKEINTRVDDQSFGVYFNENTSWTLNERDLHFKVESCVLEEEHYSVSLLAPHVESELHFLSIENTIMNSVKEHSNIIRLHYHDTSRSFRMHTGRTSSTIKL